MHDQIDTHTTTSIADQTRARADRPVITRRRRSRRLVVGVGLGLLGACFDGDFVHGLPCATDEDCGPTLSCEAGLCGGSGAHAVCGNWLLEADEECDDGNTEALDACTPDCRLSRCGDGYLGPNEACDAGPANGFGDCTFDCQPAAVCGNGTLEDGEQCDDGNLDNGDSCTSTCRKSICGDGLLGAGEQCDDGNFLENDLCTSACTIPVCGDGVVNGHEQCDDGNDSNYDSCTIDCTFVRCGDGIVSYAEECDDGNDDQADGCLTSCRIPRSCAEILAVDSSAETGPYRISPSDTASTILVTCDMQTDGGGWTGIEVEQTCNADSNPHTAHFTSSMFAVIPASTVEVDPWCRISTQDAGPAGHYHIWDLEFPPGFTQFYLSDYFIKANAESLQTSDIEPAPLATQWGPAADVQFGSALDSGPTTSYAARGLAVSCSDCTTKFTPDLTPFSVGQRSTRFRIAWGQDSDESEGWHPWWGGMVYLRDNSCGSATIDSGEDCDDGNTVESDGCLSDCTLPESCRFIKQHVPEADSGEYLIHADGQTFTVQCEMTDDGGGWTLAFSTTAEDFDAGELGVTDDTCYLGDCINRAYSMIPIKSDLLIDVSASPIVADHYTMRTRIDAIHADSIDHTLHEMFTTPNPASEFGWFVEAEDNSNIYVYPDGPVDFCSLPFEQKPWLEYTTAICFAPVLAFHATVQGFTYPIATLQSYTQPANNLNGWPNDPGLRWPPAVRIWVR